MTATKTKTINGTEYTTVLFPANEAIPLAFRLFDVFAEPLGPIADGLLAGGLEGGLKEALESEVKLSEALPKLAARLLENQGLVTALLKHTSRDGVKLDSEGAFAAAFTGRLGECAQAIRWVCEVNEFHDFFAGFARS